MDVHGTYTSRILGVLIRAWKDLFASHSTRLTAGKRAGCESIVLLDAAHMRCLCACAIAIIRSVHDRVVGVASTDCMLQIDQIVGVLVQVPPLSVLGARGGHTWCSAAHVQFSKRILNKTIA